MYLQFYQFKEYPFVIGCDPRFFYESAIHAEALANMLYTIQQKKGMVLVTGEVGAGKTFVGNILANRLGASCLAVIVQNPPQSGKQLVQALARGLGLSVRQGTDKFRLVEQVEENLRRLHARGRLVAMIIDESQDLSGASLEELRLIWNWEEQGQRLVQIVLLGQPEMRQRLMEPQWESLRQRIILSYHLGHLSAADTAAYIAHRLKVAGSQDGTSAYFAPEAVSAIFDATGGIPRLINILCDNALLVGYAKGSYGIYPTMIAEVLRDMTCWGLHVDDSPVPVAPSAS
jgi:general secretion pathway protein A